MKNIQRTTVLDSSGNSPRKVEKNWGKTWKSFST